VDVGTGEVDTEACAGCVELSKRIAVMAGKITRLENEEQERLGTAADASQIMEVLRFHKQLHGGNIYRGKAAWKAVKARFADVDAETDEPAFTVLHLRAASMGLKLDEFFGPKRMGAAWLFHDPDRVQKCGHLRLDHERERPELDLFDPPCDVHGCCCVAFDDWDWRIEIAKLGDVALRERLLGP
jgi:uncharacterized small protein (DUF1192 family)